MHYINFTNNRGFKWNKDVNSYSNGYLFDENNQLIRNENMNKYFSDIKDEKTFKESLLKSNGFFGIVIENENYVFAAVDKIRSIPIFYGYCDGCFYLSDDAHYIKRKTEETVMDELSKIEFLLTGYVTGNDTLYPNIKQIGAGEYLVYDKKGKKVNLVNYFDLKHKKSWNLDVDNLIQKLDNVHINIIKRLIDSLDGRTAVIPLSGGHDSRLIAIMLKRLGYEDVICFTYGLEGNWEAKISQEIAGKLDYKWIFIPYTKKNQQKFYDEDNIKEYRYFSDGLTSLPHIQDFYAVGQMKKRDLIPKDSVFIPGHALDFLQGSHIPSRFLYRENIKKDEMIQNIFDVHYSLWEWSKQKGELYDGFYSKIINIVGSIKQSNTEQAVDIVEKWNWKERQSKFIGNSIRVYEFFGYEWRLPFWDNEIMDFWSRVPVELRVNRKLYYQYVKKKLDTKLPEANPKRHKIIRGIDKLKSLNYRRYVSSKTFVPIIFKKVKHIIPNLDVEFIDKNKLILFINPNGLAAAKYMENIDNIDNIKKS